MIILLRIIFFLMFTYDHLHASSSMEETPQLGPITNLQDIRPMGINQQLTVHEIVQRFMVEKKFDDALQTILESIDTFINPVDKYFLYWNGAIAQAENARNIHLSGAGEDLKITEENRQQADRKYGLALEAFGHAAYHLQSTPNAGHSYYQAVMNVQIGAMYLDWYRLAHLKDHLDQSIACYEKVVDIARDNTLSCAQHTPSTTDLLRLSYNGLCDSYKLLADISNDLEEKNFYLSFYNVYLAELQDLRNPPVPVQSSENAEQAAAPGPRKKKKIKKQEK